MIYFMTTHGTLLVRNGDDIAHASLREISDAAQLLGLDMPVEALRHDWRDFVAGHARSAVPFEAAGIAGEVRLDPRLGIVHFARDGRHLSAGPDGGATTWTDGEPAEWERFLPVADGELAQILHLFRNNWVLRSSRTLVRGWDIALTPRFNLRVGPIEFPLNRNLPFEARPWPLRLTVLLEGWRIEELCLFKPLIFYACFRSPAVHAQLFASLQSLVEFGHYQGDVHVITDLDHDALCRGAPHVGRDRITVQRLGATDFVGYVGAKYAILEHAAAWDHQPILYLDPDIVINASVREMLVTVAASDVIAAPIENVGPMRSWPSVGATLLQRDAQEPRFALGFNAGTIGIPNLPVHASALRTIRRIIGNLLDSEGRESLHWVDQEAANYVSFRLAHVDTVAITPYVRYGGAGDADTVGPLTGMVHFWNTAKHDRHLVMARYIEVLRAHARAGHPLS